MRVDKLRHESEFGEVHSDDGGPSDIDNVFEVALSPRTRWKRPRALPTPSLARRTP